MKKNKLLKLAVVDSELTNYQVEDEAGLPFTKLSRFIHGAAQPSMEEKKRISRVLGKSPDEIFPPSHSSVLV